MGGDTGAARQSRAKLAATEGRHGQNSWSHVASLPDRVDVADDSTIDGLTIDTHLPPVNDRTVVPPRWRVRRRGGNGAPRTQDSLRSLLEVGSGVAADLQLRHGRVAPPVRGSAQRTEVPVPAGGGDRTGPPSVSMGHRQPQQWPQRTNRRSHDALTAVLLPASGAADVSTWCHPEMRRSHADGADWPDRVVQAVRLFFAISLTEHGATIEGHFALTSRDAGFRGQAASRMVRTRLLTNRLPNFSARTSECVLESRAAL